MSKLDTLEPEFREKVEKVIALLKERGVSVAVVCGRRTMAEQNALFAKGRTAPGNVVTNAKGGSSPHNFGLAVDLCPLNERGMADWRDKQPAWAEIGKAAEECGLAWGGKFKSIVDRPHIEDKNWRTVQMAWKRGQVEVA